uniref:FA core complex associated protein 20 n=1 Tax=Panthera leo TaxID=9689 RepID=A0A8C8XF96_PANLE
MEAARRPRLGLRRRRPSSGGGNPDAVPSVPRPPRCSPWDRTPFPGRPSHRPRAEAGAQAVATSRSLGPGGARGPPPGPRSDVWGLSPAGPPAPGSDRGRRRRPCGPAPCARPTSPPGWPSWTSTTTSLSAWRRVQRTWCGD